MHMCMDVYVYVYVRVSVRVSVKGRHLDDGYGQDGERVAEPVGVVSPRARVDDHSRRAWLGRGEVRARVRVRARVKGER